MIRWCWMVLFLSACTAQVATAPSSPALDPAPSPISASDTDAETPEKPADPVEPMHDAGIAEAQPSDASTPPADRTAPDADASTGNPPDAGPPAPSITCLKLPTWTPAYTEEWTSPPTLTPPTFDHIEWKDPPGATDYRTGAGVCVHGAACRIFFGLAGPYSAGVCQ